MFVIEGMAKVRKVIEENRKRKLTEPDADCSCCEHKSRCLYRYNAEKDSDRNKVMKINERWEALREESNANIQKYHRFLQHEIEKYEGKKEQKAA